MIYNDMSSYEHFIEIFKCKETLTTCVAVEEDEVFCENCKLCWSILQEMH